MSGFIFQYQVRADPPQQPAAPATPDQPWLGEPFIARRRTPVLSEGSPSFGQADAPAVPDLVASLPAELRRRTRQAMPEVLITPILDPAPFPGDLATTVVLGTAPCAILPSGLTPGDDVDG